MGSKTVTVLLAVEVVGSDSVLAALDQYAQGGQEVELEFTCEVSAGDPGRLSGPPERCYPPSSPEVESVTVAAYVNGKDGYKPVKLPEALSDALAERFMDRIHDDAVMQAEEMRAAEEDMRADYEMERERDYDTAPCDYDYQPDDDLPY